MVPKEGDEADGEHDGHEEHEQDVKLALRAELILRGEGGVCWVEGCGGGRKGCEREEIKKVQGDKEGRMERRREGKFRRGRIWDKGGRVQRREKGCEEEERKKEQVKRKGEKEEKEGWKGGKE